MTEISGHGKARLLCGWPRWKGERPLAMRRSGDAQARKFEGSTRGSPSRPSQNFERHFRTFLFSTPYVKSHRHFTSSLFLACDPVSPYPPPVPTFSPRNLRPGFLIVKFPSYMRYPPRHQSDDPCGHGPPDKAQAWRLPGVLQEPALPPRLSTCGRRAAWSRPCLCWPSPLSLVCLTVPHRPISSRKPFLSP